MGYKIREAREKKGFTQDELAEKSHVSRTIISGLESGAIKNTTVSTLLNLSAALGVSVNDLFFTENV